MNSFMASSSEMLLLNVELVVITSQEAYIVPGGTSYVIARTFFFSSSSKSLEPIKVLVDRDGHGTSNKAWRPELTSIAKIVSHRTRTAAPSLWFSFALLLIAIHSSRDGHTFGRSLLMF